MAWLQIHLRDVFSLKSCRTSRHSRVARYSCTLKRTHLCCHIVDAFAVSGDRCRWRCFQNGGNVRPVNAWWFEPFAQYPYETDSALRVEVTTRGSFREDQAIGQITACSFWARCTSVETIRVPCRDGSPLLVENEASLNAQRFTSCSGTGTTTRFVWWFLLHEGFDEVPQLPCWFLMLQFPP